MGDALAKILVRQISLLKIIANARLPTENTRKWVRALVLSTPIIIGPDGRVFLEVSAMLQPCRR
jgi:hypothetical protein